MTGFDAVGFGALNVDKLFKVDRIATAEQESSVTQYTETCGGSAANTIVGLARLGCKCGFIGKLAADREGNMLLNDFRAEGVDINGVIRTKRGRSGAVMGFVDERGERALYIDPGVNDTINFKDINTEYFSGAKFLHLTSFVGEESFKTQVRLLEMLPKSVKMSFDPGAIYAGMGIGKLEPLIRKAFVMMPNAGELELLTGKAQYYRGADFLIERGVRIVAIKLGKKGCFVTDGQERHLVPPFKIKTVDTTGAGDAFCAGFLYGLVKHRNLKECGRIGNFVASRCVMKMGARAGLPHAAELKLG